jgi:hypothetical protein
MTFKLSTITPEQLKNLSPKLQEEIQFVKDNTENFDELYYEAFQENDTDLHKLAEKELAKQKSPEIILENKPETPKGTKEKVKTAIEKNSPKPASPEPAESENSTYSWRRKIPTEQLKKLPKVNITCDFHAITADKNLKVEIKQTFNKGDKLLINEEGYPFAILKPDAFKKRCTTIAKQNQESQTSLLPTEKPKLNTDKPQEAKITKPNTSNESQTQDQAPLLTWLAGQIELWKNRNTNYKITKIMAIKATGDILIEQTHYDKLLRIADLRISYHKICPETTKLTKVSEPIRGSYKLLVPKEELKKEYSSDKSNWKTCRSWIREAYGCAKEGNCTSPQKELFKKFYNQCGDQVAKQEDVEYLRWLHQKAGEVWDREKETYLEAFGRILKREASSEKEV